MYHHWRVVKIINLCKVDHHRVTAISYENDKDTIQKQLIRYLVMYVV